MSLPPTPPTGLDTTRAGDARAAPGPPDAPDAPREVAEPVVAVVVASGESSGLEVTLDHLRAQDYRELTVLVVDAGAEAGLVERVADSMPGAFVRDAGEVESHAAAVNSILGSVEGATYLLLCRRGVALEPDAVRRLVEEAYRSNAGIVGPKVVDADNPDVLLEVGLSIDHYGVPYTGIEPGEIDQEQHDAVRDVFYVSSTAMLVRADLFAELEGFDVETFPGVFDLDLCWRANLAGARVLVVPDARARHHRTVHGAEVTMSHGAAPREVMRNRLRVIAKNYSALALVWVLPVAFVLNVFEAIAFLFTKHRRRSLHVLGAWPYNLRNLRSVLAARRVAQRSRRVGDHEVRSLMTRGSARIRTFTETHLHAGDRLQDASLTASRVATRTRVGLRRVEVVAAVVGLALLVFGSRNLVFDRVPEVGQLVNWGSLGDLFATYWSSWRFTGLGTEAAASPAFGLSGVLSTLAFGSTALARTLTIVGGLGAGVTGAYRLARPLSRSPWPGLAAAAAYAANPLVLNAVSNARLGVIVVYAIAPFAARILFASSESGEVRLFRYRTGWVPVLRLAILVAIASAFWPPALLLGLLFGVVLVVSALLVGGWRLAVAGLATSARATLIALALSLPWTLGLVDADWPSLAVLPRSSLDLGAVLRFDTGQHAAGLGVLAIYVAAALPLFVAEGVRLAWAARAWVLVAVCFALAWAPSRIDASLPVPDAQGVLVGAALGLSLAVGLSVATFVDDLRRTLFGWRQVLAAAAVLCVVVPTAGLVVSSIDGDWGLPNEDWTQATAWMAGEAEQIGRFRVLWVGDPSVLPVDATVTAGVGWGFSRDGASDLTARYLAPAGDAGPVVEEAISLAVDARTSRLGRLLAPMGVRYVVALDRSAPTSDVVVPLDPVLADSLGEQLDLAIAQTETGMTLYENEAWAPSLAVMDGGTGGVVPTGGSTDPTTAALRSDLAAAEPVLGARSQTEPVGPGTLVWAEAYDSGWEARQEGESLEHVETFGWANGWDAPDNGELEVVYDRGVLAPLLVVAQVLLWVLAVVVLVRARRAKRTGTA